jgi:SpoU rRNA methylase family enzyme
MMNKYMHGWIGGKHVYYVDFIGISSLMGLGVKDFTVGRAALKAASSKIAKHEKTCYDNQHVFILFVFDTFDFLALEVVDLLKRVQRVMCSNIVSHRSINVIFRRIGFTI